MPKEIDRRSKPISSEGTSTSRRGFFLFAGVTAVTSAAVMLEAIHEHKSPPPEDVQEFFPSLAQGSKSFVQGDIITPGHIGKWYNFSDLIVNQAAVTNLYTIAENFVQAQKNTTLRAPLGTSTFKFNVFPLATKMPVVTIIAPESASAPTDAGLSKENPGSTYFLDGKMVSRMKVFPRSAIPAEDDPNLSTTEQLNSLILATQIFAGSLAINSDTPVHKEYANALMSSVLATAYVEASKGTIYDNYAKLVNTQSADLPNNQSVANTPVPEDFFNNLKTIPLVLSSKK